MKKMYYIKKKNRGTIRYNKKIHKESLKDVTLLGLGVSIALSAQLFIEYYGDSININILVGLPWVITIFLFFILLKVVHRKKWHEYELVLKKKIKPKILSKNLRELWADKQVGREDKQHWSEEDYLSCSLLEESKIKRGYLLDSIEHGIRIFIFPKMIIMKAPYNPTLDEWVKYIEEVLKKQFR